MEIMITDNRVFTQGEVNRIFSDVPRETLLFWAKSNLLDWENEKVDGRGIHRGYSHWNLTQFGIIKEIMALGIHIDKAKKIMDANFKYPSSRMATLRLSKWTTITIDIPGITEQISRAKKED